jgi:hypothetical protein
MGQENRKEEARFKTGKACEEEENSKRFLKI